MENQLPISSNNNRKGLIFGVVSLFLLLISPFLIVLGIFLLGGEHGQFGSFLGFLTTPLSVLFFIISIIYTIRSFHKKEGKKSALILNIIYVLLWVGGFILMTVAAKGKPLSGGEYRVQCGRVYFSCLPANRTGDAVARCREQEQKCYVDFQKKGLIPPIHIDRKGLTARMDKMARNGTIIKWQLSPDEFTLVIYVSEDTDLSQLANRIIRKDALLKTYDQSYLHLAFSKFVHNNGGDNCTEVRTLSEKVLTRNCGRYNP